MLRKAVKENDGVTFIFSFGANRGLSSRNFPVSGFVKAILEKEVGTSGGITVVLSHTSKALEFFIHFHRITYVIFSANFHNGKNPLAFIDNLLDSIVDSNFDRILDSDIVEFEVDGEMYGETDSEFKVEKNWK